MNTTEKVLKWVLSKEIQWPINIGRCSMPFLIREMQDKTTMNVTLKNHIGYN